MKFAIQHNLMNDSTLNQINNALKSHKIPHVFVGIIPFTREITCDEDIAGVDYIPYGSTTLTVVTHQLGWRGQCFDPETFRADVWDENRSDMLNQSTPHTVESAIKYLRTRDKNETIFSRPAEDLKLYSGMVIECGELADWLEDAMLCASSGSYKLDPVTPIVIADPKVIHAEWRHFIVGGKIIDSSMYRRSGQLYKKHEDDHDVLDESQQLADIWLPHECCVMDTALTDNGVSVIEFNTINSSGFYDNDVEKIIVSLWNYFKEG